MGKKGVNYRHVYHAGNFADVVKHVILARVLTYMGLKPQPYRVIDTHAGAGIYDLRSPEAGKTSEWRDGIARLLAAPRPDDINRLLQPYLDAVAAVNSGGTLLTYPGSPIIARRLMRPGDHLVANELHPNDYASLKIALRGAVDSKVLNIDAWLAVKSLLPPKERRAVVLIDPPFEKPDEFDRLAEAMDEALKRFATGIFVIWHPVKDEAAADRLRARVSRASGCKVLGVRLRICNPEPGLGLTETGILIVNPPFVLEDELKNLLPFLASVLREGPGAAFTLAGSSQ